MAGLKTEGSNQELSVQDRDLLEELEYEAEAGDDAPENILVRGALLQCSCGTHCRRLNLKKSYGVYAEDGVHPRVHKKNCIVGDDENITYFGVCQSGNKPEGSKQVCLEPYVWPDGTKTSSSNIDGLMCKPVILGDWFDALDDEKILDLDDENAYPGLKMKSYLVCKYGGLIVPRYSGQEYTGK